MGYARLALYITGLVVVVLAAWLFLTQTPLADQISPSIALAIIVLLVGIGVMASARAMNDTYSYRKRVLHDGEHGHAPGPATPPDAGRTETVVEERRY